jgi:hypothetical protein
LIFSKEPFQGDEERYITFAQNLSHGYYSPPPPDINLWNGPGYPIILIPFVMLKTPYIYIKLLNAVFLYFTLILFFLTLKSYIRNHNSVVTITIIMGFLMPYYTREMVNMVTESFTLFLVSSFIYSVCTMFSNFSRYKLLVSSFLLSYLCLTKIIFGYVILVAGLIFILLSLVNKSRKVKISIFLFILSILFSLPYLTYTYSITHKIYYWGNSGGDSMYWMSSPYQDEFGSWQSMSFESESIRKNHSAFFESISGLKGIDRDTALKNKAVENIKRYPKKYLINWFSNIERLLFNFPISHEYQKPNFMLVPMILLSSVMVFLIYPTIKFAGHIPFEIIFLLIFSLIYIFISSLVAVYIRQFVILFPVVGLWIGYMLTNVIDIHYNENLSLKD